MGQFIRYVKIILPIRCLNVTHCFCFLTGQFINGSNNGSIILIIGFKSFFDVATLLKDYESGALTDHFRPIQDAVRRIPGYEDYTLTVDITLKDYLNFLNKIGK